MQDRDWSSTSLGPVEDWPEHLKSPLRLMLASAAATFIWWGPELIHLNNDACARLFGRGRSTGRPTGRLRQDIWNVIGAEVLEALSSNRAVSTAARSIVVSRNGGERELFCSFSLTPIRDGRGNAVGVLGVGTDETETVLARRRLDTLDAVETASRTDARENACARAAAALAGDPEDIPFALIYVTEQDGATARLAATAGRTPAEVAAVLRLDEDGPWPLRDLAPGDPPRRAGRLPDGFDAGGAAVIALGGESGAIAGYLIVGLAARRPYDGAFRNFLNVAAGSIRAAMTASAAASRDEDRDEFLAMLAHELRNPLAPIRSAAELLAFVERNPMSLAQARTIIDRQLAQLVRLVDDLLDASRIGRGALALKRAPLDLRTALASAIESVRPLADEAGHRLEVRMPEAAVGVHGDHARLTQALANLLTNAVQYTGAGGRIRVRLDADADTARLEVEDNGVGIDEALLPKLFEMFTQGEQRPGEARRGLGLGLAVARRLVEMHDGTLDGHSHGKDNGSVFTVTLPTLAAESSRADTPTPLPQPAAIRVLVADDNVDAGAALAEVLGALGHEVRTAEDGLAAVELADRFRPDLILLDIGMPRLDGFEACRQIREKAWGREVAIYAVTGWGQPSDRRRTREAGFNAHLVKPVSVASIKQLISRQSRQS